MLRRFLLRSLVAVLIWLLLIEIGGAIIEARHCGHVGCAAGTDDLGLGMSMVIFAMQSGAVVAVGLVLYQLLMSLRSR